jgi:2-iminobutanoate/2-iminopropanoate deaminase
MKFLPVIDTSLPFSLAVHVDDIVYFSGNIGIRPDGTLPDGIEAQSALAMDNMLVALHTAGCTIDDVFKCTVMLADMAQWTTFNEIYVPYFKAGRLPARSAFGTSGLALGALVEVECMAHLPGQK